MNKCVVFSVVLLVLFLILDANFKIIRVVTRSIPYKYCVHLLKVFPKKGDLCVFKKNGMTIVKYIAAEEGDSVKIIRNSVFINEKKICELSPDGRFSPIMDQIIPAGYVFMMGTHPDSFDSRYQWFGLVNKEDIQGKAIPLIKRAK